MNNLPTELVLHVMQYCSIGAATRLLSCNQALYMCTEWFWRDACMRDFGRTLDHLIVLPTLYRAIHDCAKAVNADLEATSTEFDRACFSELGHAGDRIQYINACNKRFDQTLVPLQQLLADFSCSYASANPPRFAAAIDLATSIGCVAESQIVIERLCKHVAHEYAPMLHDMYASAGIVAAINEAVKINGATTHPYAVRKLANVVARLILDDNKRGVNTYIEYVIPLFGQYNVRTYNWGITARGDNILVTDIFCKLTGAIHWS